MKLIAQSPKTGLYFDGVSFVEADAAKAKVLPPDITAEAFKLFWGGDVEVIDVDAVRSHCPNWGNKSLAQRIHEGELNEYSAAMEYVLAMNRGGQRSFPIRTSTGDYISRVVKLDKKGDNRVAWINFCGYELAVIWSRGELALEWAS